MVFAGNNYRYRPEPLPAPIEPRPLAGGLRPRQDATSSLNQAMLTGNAPLPVMNSLVPSSGSINQNLPLPEWRISKSPPPFSDTTGQQATTESNVPQELNAQLGPASAIAA